MRVWEVRRRQKAFCLLITLQTITGEYYYDVLYRLRAYVNGNGRGKVIKWVLHQHDNARMHIFRLAVGAVKRYGLKCLLCQLYLPDLTPSDYCFFPSLKTELPGQFLSDDALQI